MERKVGILEMLKIGTWNISLFLVVFILGRLTDVFPKDAFLSLLLIASLVHIFGCLVILIFKYLER